MPKRPPASEPPSDLVVIGAGLAGLSLALRFAEQGQVTVLAKADLTYGSSLYAQGGIAAVLDPEDSLAAHVADTLDAGAGLCHRDAVDFVVREAPAAITWLIERGVPFTAQGVGYHLTREGGHTHRRIIHAADATGRAVETTLAELARRHPRIRILEHHIAIDLVTAAKLGLPGPNRCLGVYVFDKAGGHVRALRSRLTALATGGASKVYLYSSNPDTSTGDGIAMAWRAGCRVANMEFVQFHPTCLYHPQAKSFLISEAVRGEGGHLLRPDGTRFMLDYDPRGELAPRDIVARAIDNEMKRGGLDAVALDISHRGHGFIVSHFPNIHERCLQFGYDMSKGPIPVVPAAHYTCGGIMTDLRGRTDLAGLYAVGECAFTGLHGANRLASNSLLECVVLGAAAALDASAQRAAEPPMLPPWDESRVTDADEGVVVAHNWEELRRFMWDYVGIVRTNRRLERALHRITVLTGEIHDYYANFRVTNDLIELRNLAQVAELIIRSAQLRTESRGLHYSRDYPETDTAHSPRDTVLTPGQFARAAETPGYWPV
ncbi:MAG: L-aspartate oxidase [Gammaproteobacteria bacterium]|nr:L-aspartate oxidase [Gammaproteobacteria bacterium]